MVGGKKKDEVHAHAGSSSKTRVRKPTLCEANRHACITITKQQSHASRDPPEEETWRSTSPLSGTRPPPRSARMANDERRATPTGGYQGWSVGDRKMSYVHLRAALRKTRQKPSRRFKMDQEAQYRKTYLPNLTSEQVEKTRFVQVGCFTRPEGGRDRMISFHKEACQLLPSGTFPIRIGT